MRALKRFFGDGRGASAVEFSLVVVPLLLFIFGTIELSRIMWTRQTMQSLAISAARCMGILQPSCISGSAYDETTTKNYIINKAASYGVPLATGDITLSVTGGCGTLTGGFSTVAITYNFISVAPRLITALGGTTVLSASACFPNQN